MALRFNSKLIVLFAISFFLISLPVLAFAAAVSISPSTVNTSPGSQFTVSINISDVSNLFGVAFDLIFNPGILSFVSAQKGTFLEQGGATTLLLTAVNPPGDLIVGYSRQTTGGVTGSGTLMTITFNALTAGTSNLTFQNNALCDPTGVECNVIPATWTGGTVSVASLTADFNSDGRVNSVDFGILMSYWGSTAKPAADINQDGIVNSVDFGIMMSQWG